MRCRRESSWWVGREERERGREGERVVQRLVTQVSVSSLEADRSKELFALILAIIESARGQANPGVRWFRMVHRVRSSLVLGSSCWGYLETISIVP